MENNNTFDYSELTDEEMEVIRDLEEALEKWERDMIQHCGEIWDCLVETKSKTPAEAYVLFLKRNSLFDYAQFDKDTAIKKMREQLEKNFMELSPEEFCNNPMRFIRYNNEEV